MLLKVIVAYGNTQPPQRHVFVANNLFFAYFSVMTLLISLPSGPSLFDRVPNVPSQYIDEKKLSTPWRPKREEAVEGIVILAADATAVVKVIKEQRSKVGSKGFPLQPFLLAVGKSWSQINQWVFYVTETTESLTYTVDYQIGFRYALEKLYKLIWAVDAHYPKGAKALYDIIESQLFPLTTIVLDDHFLVYEVQTPDPLVEVAYKLSEIYCKRPCNMTVSKSGVSCYD